MSTLILVRGLPGSGKTTIAQALSLGLLGEGYDESTLVSADDFFHVGDDEPHCTYNQLKDPTLLRGTDYARYRAGRSVRPLMSGDLVPYKFEPSLLVHAHTWCIEQARNEMARSSQSAIIVHNTFTRRWEMEPYLQMAESFDVRRVNVVSLYDGGCSDAELAYRNTHGVPESVITTFRAQWETDWRNAPRERSPAPATPDTSESS